MTRLWKPMLLGVVAGFLSFPVHAAESGPYSLAMSNVVETGRAQSGGNGHDASRHAGQSNATENASSNEAAGNGGASGGGGGAR